MENTTQFSYEKLSHLMNNDFNLYDVFTPLSTIHDGGYKTRFFDSWVNEIANINCNNSIMQYADFHMKRMQYTQLAELSTDTIINKAINTLSKDIIGNKGTFLITEEVKNQNDIIIQLENRLTELDFWNILKKAIETTLIYGGSLLYLKSVNQLDQDVPFQFESFQGVNALKELFVLEPIYASPGAVNFNRPYEKDFMKPRRWRIYNAEIDSSQLIPIVIFDLPSLYKPLYNYLGISYIQFMHSYVRNAETIRESLSDIFLRFRSLIVKTSDHVNEKHINERMKFYVKALNNLGVLILKKDEEFIETITSITGLESILNQAYQNLAVAARMPAVKLLGLSPQGLNNTGEFDMKNYYDEIESYQKSIFSDIITKVAQCVLWSLGHNYTVKFEFTPISQESYSEQITRLNNIASLVEKLTTNGFITEEQGFELLKQYNVIDDSMSFNPDDDLDIDEPTDEPVDKPTDDTTDEEAIKE